MVVGGDRCDALLSSSVRRGGVEGWGDGGSMSVIDGGGVGIVCVVVEWYAVMSSLFICCWRMVNDDGWILIR